MTNARPILSTRVPDSARMNFLPALFGIRALIRGETLVYAWMERLSDDYQGGFWEFFTTSNGAMYMAPSRAGKMRISVDTNGFAGELSADAAGIVATLFALNHLANDTEEDHFIELFHLLRDFAVTHAEAALIYQAID